MENTTEVMENKKNIASDQLDRADEKKMEGPQPKVKVVIEDYMPLEIYQTIKELSTPKLGNDGKTWYAKTMTVENGRITLPKMEPLQQCQYLHQIQCLIHFHEKQPKVQSYLQLELLRDLHYQLKDQIMLHPNRQQYEELVEAEKTKRVTPLSIAERAQIVFFTQIADWTLEARSGLRNKESPSYLKLFGCQVTDYKKHLNEITTHEQFQIYAPMLAERIDYHREMINMLQRNSSVSLLA